jgi:hypothetical protein
MHCLIFNGDFMLPPFEWNQIIICVVVCVLVEERERERKGGGENKREWKGVY